MAGGGAPSAASGPEPGRRQCERVLVVVVLARIVLVVVLDDDDSFRRHRLALPRAPARQTTTGAYDEHPAALHAELASVPSDSDQDVDAERDQRDADDSAHGLVETRREARADGDGDQAEH